MYPYSLFSKNQDAEIVIAVKVRRIQKISFKFDGFHSTVSIFASGHHWWACFDYEQLNKITLCVGPLPVLDSSK